LRIRAENLGIELSRKLLPCYLLSGDEPLLINESADLIRKTCKQQGFAERQVFNSDSIKWEDFISEGQSMSLFAEKRIIELRIANSKPGDKGSKALVEFLAQISEDILLLVITGKLERSQQKSKWVTALDKLGGHIQAFPVEQKHMPGWLSQRLTAYGIQADREAINLLAERVEGNLLAAQQEVEKIALLANGHIDTKTMADIIVSSARYDVFSLIDHCLAGRTTEALTNLKGLKEEGTEVTSILWFLTKEIRQLVQIHNACQQGQSLEQAIRSVGIWQKKQPVTHKAARRTSMKKAKTLLSLCQSTDRAIKSSQEGNPWLKLKTIVVELSGCTVFF